MIAAAAMRHRRIWIDAAACLSLSNLCFAQARLETLFLSDYDFHNKAPLGAMALGVLLLNIGALAALGLLAARAVRSSRRIVWRRLAAVAGVIVLVVPLNAARLTYEPAGRWADALGQPGAVAIVAALLAVAFWRPRAATRAMRWLLVIVSPLVAFTVLHVVALLADVAVARPARLETPAPLTRPAPSLRRVVWLVLTELDQRIAFEARPAGLALPELDRLRGESLYALAARPPGGTTGISMPALVTGRPVVGAEPVSANDVALTFADGTVARWRAQPTVFSRARLRGYDTAVVGWHLPYPRLLGASLGFAEWQAAPAHENARAASFTGTVVNQWAAMAPPLNLRRLARRRTAELLGPAVAVAGDGRFALVLLHLPLPRPPGIYDRATGRLTAWNFAGAGGGYFDNLALADRVLGEVRTRIDRAGLGDRTWLVVSSDQWWRDAREYDGRVDRRVPFLVRAPAASRTVPVDGAFSTLVTHDLLLAILGGEVDTTEAAAVWLARRAPAPPKDYTQDGRPIY